MILCPHCGYKIALPVDLRIRSAKVDRFLEDTKSKLNSLRPGVKEYRLATLREYLDDKTLPDDQKQEIANFLKEAIR